MSKQLTEIQSIGENLRTQDIRCTAEPMFCVQEKKTIYGLDPRWADSAIWIDTSDGICECAPPKDEKETDTIYLTNKMEYWETVMVAFTEAGCKEYLRLNVHNHLGETRIYIESFRRCPEMIAIRKMLIEDQFTAALKERDAWCLIFQSSNAEVARLNNLVEELSEDKAAAIKERDTALASLAGAEAWGERMRATLPHADSCAGWHHYTLGSIFEKEKCDCAFALPAGHSLDKVREALVRLRDCDEWMMIPLVRSIAREALESIGVK